MKKYLILGIILILLSSFVIVGLKHQYRDDHRELVTDSLVNGSMLQACSDEFFRLNQRHPTIEEFRQILTNAFVGGYAREYFSELTASWEENRVNEKNTFISLTGKGGWFYDTNTGTIAINVTNKINFKGFEIVPSQIKFTPLPSSPELNKCTELKSFITNRIPSFVESVKDNFSEKIDGKQ